MPFQTVVNAQQAPAVEGDFASANPRHVMLAGEAAITAGPGGLIIGRFAFVRNDLLTATNVNPGVPFRTAFVHRDQVALIPTGYPPNEATLVVPAGLEVTVFDAGDFWARFAAGAVVGQKVFANYADGTLVAGTAGSPPTGGVVTGSIAAAAASVTGSIAPSPAPGSTTGILTVTAVASGVLVPLGVLSGTGVTASTAIVNQLSGTPGGVGTYLVNKTQTTPSTAITETAGGGLMTVTAVSSGVLAVGDVISGTSVTAGTYVTSIVTGSGGIGTYGVSQPTVVTSTTITALGAFETNFLVDSIAGNGELAQISTH